MARARKRAEQPTLFDTIAEPESRSSTARSSTFLDNLSIPIHRWFRYSAGFSADWVREVIARDDSLFEPLISGKTGVGGAYDLWRRLKAWGTLRKFRPGHAEGQS